MIKGSSKEERVKNWFDHFKNLLGKTDDLNETEDEVIDKVLTGLNINDSKFTISELVAAKKSMKDGKQSGPDDMAPEVIKRCDLAIILLDFVNKLIEHQVKPKQWSEIDMLPLPKSGDLTNTQNY